MKKFCLFIVMLVLLIGCMTISASADASTDTVEEATEEEFDSLFDEERNRDNEHAIQSVDSGVAVNPATVGSPLDAYDILTRLALVFTLVAVVILWIRHTIQDRKDPIKKYMK